MNSSGNPEIATLENYMEPWKAWKEYLTPVIIATGLIGNTLSFAVFVFSSLRRYSISVYLSGLSVSDTGFLLTVGAVWLDGRSDIPLFDTDAKCQLLIFTTFVFSFLSVWYVVAFTSEIYFSIFYPLRSNKFCKRKVATVITFVLLAISIFTYVAIFWTVKTHTYKGETGCHFDDIDIVRSTSIADSVLTLILPFSLLFIMNIRIFIDMLKFYNRSNGQSASVETNCLEDDSIPTTKSSICSRNLTEGFAFTSFEQPAASATFEDEVSECSSTNMTNVSDRRSKGQADTVKRKTRKMLLIVTGVFLLLNLPSHLIRVQHCLRTMYDQMYRPSAMEMFWLDVFNTVHWVNYAINFALYSACAKSFRQVVVRGFWTGLRKLCMVCVWRERTGTRPIKRRRPTQPLVSVPNMDKVECHLSAIRFSHLKSLDVNFVLDSPPCLLARTGGLGGLVG